MFWADFRELAFTTIRQIVDAQFSDYTHTRTTKGHFAGNRPEEVLAVPRK
jgi:hypothetical protein